MMICKLIQSNKHIPLHPLGGCNKYKKKKKSRQLMSGDLAGQAMVVRSTWNRARAYRAFAGASF